VTYFNIITLLSLHRGSWPLSKRNEYYKLGPKM